MQPAPQGATGSVPEAADLHRPAIARTAASASASASASAHPPPLGGEPLAALNGAVVILVEDDAAVRCTTADVLTQWGAKVVAAAHVEEALARLVMSPLRPALVIADGRLAAGASGVEAVQRVRDEYNDDDLPALVVSADLAALQAARAAGVVALRKPVTPAALAAAVGQALDVRLELGE